MATFLRRSSLSLISCSFRLPSLCFFHLSRVERPDLHGFHPPVEELALQQARCAIRGLMGMKLIIPNKEVYMSSIADSSVIIQSSSEDVPCPPPWFGEVALIVEHLRQQGVLTKIGERICFARRRFGHYEGAT